MKTIKSFVVSVSLFLAVGSVQAESVTVSSYVTNKYLAFGTGSVLSNDAAVQSDAFMSFNNGFYAGLWSSRSLSGSWNDGSLGNELDYAIGWKGSVANEVTMNIGSCYFDEPRALTLGVGDILKTYMSVTKDCKLGSVTLGYENYLTMPGSGFHGGNLVTLGVSRSLSVSDGKFGLRASVIGVYDFGTLGTRSGFIARGTVGVDWNASKRLTVNVLGVNWFVPLTAHDKRVTNAMFTTGITFKAK
ncbi:MAG: TorF family putative porin [Candidatus Paceibacterota bacterium]